MDEACAIANRIAPEHLELSLADADDWVEKITMPAPSSSAPIPPESLGDYCAGPNHIADVGQRAALVAARRRFPEAYESDPRLESGFKDARAYRPRRWRKGEGLPAHTRRNTASKIRPGKSS